jgi:DNA oxidative demethylase
LTADLFESVADVLPSREVMAEGAVLLRGFACSVEAGLLAAISEIEAQAPFRRMFTPGGHQMSVAMTNCGKAGWVTDRSGYRYDGADPESGKPWPAMPPVLRELAEAAAQEAGFAGFAPDACLINHYEPGAKMSLHQDRDEKDFAAPIVRCRWACRPFSCSEAPNAATRRSVIGWRMATSWSGAGRPGCTSTASHHWPPASIRCSGGGAST